MQQRSSKKHLETLTDAFEQNKAVPEENCLMASGHQKQYDDSEQCMMLNAGVSFRHSDMFSAFPEIEPFDVIVETHPTSPVQLSKSWNRKYGVTNPGELLTGLQTDFSFTEFWQKNVRNI